MILVTGSLAYDYIMTHNDRFEDQFQRGGLHNLSIAFRIDNLRKYRGGTAGNIAYNLKLLDESPILMATAGYDFSDYSDFLKLQGINDSCVTILEDQTTATAFIATDKNGAQITFFHPGAMDYAAKKDIAPLHKKIKLAIIAPENKLTMIHYAQQCKNLKIPYLFDPGQNVGSFNKDELLDCIDGSKGFIVNDYEWQLFYGKTHISKEKIIEKTEMLIITMGEKGSKIFSKKENIFIEAFRPHEIHDPTGCGDAYRAGLLKGLKNKLEIQETGKYASLAATYCVEEHGTQNHSYTLKSFETRLKNHK